MVAHEWYSSYDALVPRICPDYELGLDAIVNSIPARARGILELGSGTGNLTVRLAQKFPDAVIVGIDKDAKMLESAREKTRNYKNVHLNEGVFPFINFGRFDAVVSSLLFHLLPEWDRIETLEIIYKSGTDYVAVFDRMRGETQEVEDMFFGYFVRQLLGKGLPGNIAYDLIKESARNHPMKLSELMAVYRANMFRFEILHQSPNHGFIAYGGVRK